MPWNGSGQFTRNFSWVNDAANSIPITSSRVDSDSNDITGNGFGNTLTRDGQGSATANLPMNGFKHTNCAAGVAATDYATVGQITPLAPLNSPTFTGTPLAPTAAPGNNTTQIATTAFVVTALGSYLPLSGGQLTGPITSFPGALGTSGGSAITPIVSRVTSSNTDSIFTTATRISNGSDWTTVQWKINRGVDVTPHGFIAFPDTPGGTGLAFGSGGSTYGTMTGLGQWTFSSAVTMTSGLSVSGSTFTYGGTAQPHIFVQSGTPTAIAVGDLWFF